MTAVGPGTPSWLEGWAPTTSEQQLVVEAGPAQALAAGFDDGLPAPRVGDPLPPLWHYAALSRWAPGGEIGLDGHPRRGGDMPPVPLPRRMHAGSVVTFPGTLRVGDVAIVRTRAHDVQVKHGRSGSLVLVTVVREVHVDGAAQLVERMQVVYRDHPSGAAHATATPDVSPAVGLVRRGPWDWELPTDPVLLMRFSAATSNAHRIHYDQPYACGEEGYPGLVVQGPLLAMALAELLRLELPGRRVTSFSFRATRPAFCGQRLRLRGELEDGGIGLVASTDDGACMTGEVRHA